MVFHIACNNDEEHNAIVTLIRAFALYRVEEDSSTESMLSKEERLVKEFSDNDVPPSRFHLLDLTHNPVTEIGTPSQPHHRYRDYLARVIKDQSIFNNVYWYLRDVSTPTHITFVLSDAADFDKAQAGLDGMAKVAIDRVGKYLRSGDAKSALTHDMKEALTKEPLAYETWTWRQVNLSVLKKVMIGVHRRVVAKNFAMHSAMHAALYNPLEPLSIGWAHFCDYKRPFHEKARLGRGEALIDYNGEE